MTIERESPRSVTRGCNSQQLTGPTEQATASSSDYVLGTLGVHWLRGSFPAEEKAWVRACLGRWFGEEETAKPYGYWCYDRHYAWPSGVMLLYHSTPAGAEMTQGRFAVEIPGHVLDDMDMADVVCLCNGFKLHGFQASRLDLFFDDAERIATPTMLYQTVYEESLFEGTPIREDFTGFRDISRVVESKKGQGRKRDEVRFGRRGKQGSGKYLRVYDKNLESVGGNAAVRWELELSDKRADAAFQGLALCLVQDFKPAAVSGLIGSFIGGSIDFRKRGENAGSKNLCRCPRYEFWQQIIDKLGRLPLRGKTSIKLVEKAQEYIRRQVSGTLQMIKLAIGAEEFFPWLVELVDTENRLRSQHYKALAEYRSRITGHDALNIHDIREFCDEKAIQLEQE